MKLMPLYSSYNRNVGRIKAINDDSLVANINAGHGGGDMELPLTSCYNFVPQVNDRVFVCVDDDGDIEGYILQKLNKNR